MIFYPRNYLLLALYHVAPKSVHMCSFVDTFFLNLRHESSIATEPEFLLNLNCKTVIGNLFTRPWCLQSWQEGARDSSDGKALVQETEKLPNVSMG